MADNDDRSGGLLDRWLRHATVTEVEQRRPRIRRIRLAGTDLTGLPWQAGQQIRVRVHDSGLLASLVRGRARDLLRTYSIYDLDPIRGELDLCVYQRDDANAPGLDWSRRVVAGDTAAFLGPEGRFVLQPDTPYHVVVGEETAQMAFAPMLAAAPAGTPVFGVLEVATPDDRLDVVRGGALTWLYRGGSPAADSQTLVRAVRDLELPDRPGIAYLAGEARTIAAIQRHLIRERGWPRRSVLTKPFWAPGRRGLD